MTCDQRLVFGRTRSWLSCRESRRRWGEMDRIDLFASTGRSLLPLGGLVTSHVFCPTVLLWVWSLGRFRPIILAIASARGSRRHSLAQENVSRTACLFCGFHVPLPLTPKARGLQVTQPDSPACARASARFVLSCILPSMHYVAIDCPSSSLRYFLRGNHSDDVTKVCLTSTLNFAVVFHATGVAKWDQ